MGDILTYINLGFSVVIVILGIILLVKSKKGNELQQNKQIDEVLYKLASLSDRLEMLNKDTDSRHSTLRTEISGGITSNVSRLGDSLRDQQEKQLNRLTDQLEKLTSEFEKIRSDTLSMLEKMQKENSESMEKFRSENKQSLNEVQQNLDKSRNETADILIKIQTSNSESMEKLRTENQQSLDKINDTVNEKLQKTLNDRITQSFETVNKQLTQVYQGLGEMKQVASGVNDLKRVLSNVKTRGIMGEIQLEAILSEILAPEQYESQVHIIPDSNVMADFGVKLPGNDKNHPIWLPIDSKFPGGSYTNLLEAYDKGNSEEIKVKRAVLETEIKREAKSISEKYIKPPFTTDFAILFLPFEGLYAEVINLGLVEQLQKDYKINVAGPSTMAAMLNSLRMGFRTLEIQEKSSEVWHILEKAKMEFNKFGNVLDAVRKKLNQADKDLGTLIGTRTKAINKSLENVELFENTDQLTLSRLFDDDYDDSEEDDGELQF